MSDKKQRGFTLIETLLSVVILGVGLIGIYRPLLSSMSTLYLLNQKIEGSRIASRLMWDLEDRAQLAKVMVSRQDRGEETGLQTVYSYRMKSTDLGKQDRLYQVEYRLSWSQTGQRKSLTQQAYLMVPLKDDEEK